LILKTFFFFLNFRATLIGLSIRAKLLYTLPSRYKVGVNIIEGAHIQENQINKQLNDKERVTAALENNHLRAVVNRCIVASDT
jgi:hypothetical protein